MNFWSEIIKEVGTVLVDTVKKNAVTRFCKFIVFRFFIKSSPLIKKLN